jgi:hypothetical protein
LLYIGLDPGISGGVAVLGGGELAAWATPVLPHVSGKGKEVDVLGVWRLVDEQARRVGAVDAEGNILVTRCAIELVGTQRRRDAAGVAVRQGVTGAFNFGDSFGHVRALAKLMAWPTVYPKPAEWQKAVLGGNKLGDTKATSIAYVAAAYPGLSLLRTALCSTPHDGMADAVCLAVFASRPTA